jgi:hypothetical protein
MLSILLLTTPSLSAPAPAPVADDGMWHPSGAQASTWTPTTTAAAGSLKPSASSAGVPYSQMAVTAKDGATASKVTSLTVAATVATPSAGADWQSAVTWPAGCETWANPCPPGAHIVGGATATGGAAGTATGTDSYENGFTSYTTMTDSNGVITGMPPKATIAAGVTVKPSSNSSVTLKTLTSSPGSSGTSSGFSFSSSTAKPATANGAASMSAPFVLGAAALVAALL